MTEKTSSGRLRFFRSIVFKNILLFLLILLVAVVPLAFRYYQDSRNYEIKVLASRLEFFAERGAAWLNPEDIHTLRNPSDKQTNAYLDTVETLGRIEKEFKVDNAIVMRRREDRSFEYVAVGYNAFRGSSRSSPGAANPCSPAGRKTHVPRPWRETHVLQRAAARSSTSAALRTSTVCSLPHTKAPRTPGRPAE